MFSNNASDLFEEIPKTTNAICEDKRIDYNYVKEFSFLPIKCLEHELEREHIDQLAIRYSLAICMCMHVNR
jgi:hypothetical protein